MSNYRHEWMVTYIGGPTLMILAMVPVIGTGTILGQLLHAMTTTDSNGLVTAVISMLTTLLLGAGAAVVTFAYGYYVFITGRRTLASDHWRTEDFQR